jgi:hypothetical protein
LSALGGLNRVKFKPEKEGSLVIPGFGGGYVKWNSRSTSSLVKYRTEWRCLSLASVLVSLIKGVLSVKSSTGVWIDLDGLNNPSVEKGLVRVGAKRKWMGIPSGGSGS